MILSIKKIILQYTIRVKVLIGPNLKYYLESYYDNYITNNLEFDDKVFEIKQEYVYERDYKSYYLIVDAIESQK